MAVVVELLPHDPRYEVVKIPFDEFTTRSKMLKQYGPFIDLNGTGNVLQKSNIYSFYFGFRQRTDNRSIKP